MPERVAIKTAARGPQNSVDFETWLSGSSEEACIVQSGSERKDLLVAA
jgi:hypothetical protein